MFLGPLLSIFIFLDIPLQPYGFQYYLQIPSFISSSQTHAFLCLLNISFSLCIRHLKCSIPEVNFWSFPKVCSSQSRHFSKWHPIQVVFQTSNPSIIPQSSLFLTLISNLSVIYWLYFQNTSRIWSLVTTTTATALESYLTLLWCSFLINNLGVIMDCKL